MLSYDASSKLAALLLSISSEEQQTETLRENLCQYRDFEPYAAFQRIERSHTGAIVSNDIRSFLAEHRIFYAENDCYIFIRRFDTNGDSQLTYNEFLNALLPLNNPHLRAIATQRMNFKVKKNQYLSFDTEKALARLIDKEISLYLNLDLQKARLFQQDDFTYAIAFSTIDKYSSSYIDYDNLRAFLLGQALYPEKHDIIAILRRLDRGEKGLVSYKEFVAEVESLSESVRDSIIQGNKFNTQTTGQKSLTTPQSRRNSNSEACAYKLNKESVTPGQTTQYALTYGSPPLSSEKVKNSYKLEQASSSMEAKTEINATPFVSSCLASPQILVKGNNEGKDQFSVSQRRSSLSTAAKTSTKEVNLLKEFTLSPERDVQRTLTFIENKVNISFIQTLRHLLKFAKELEISKEKLALRPDFNIPAFFRSFGPEMKVFVSINQFEQGMKQYGIYPDKKEVQLLFKRYDKDEDRALKAPDFEDMLISNQYELASLVVNRGPFRKDVQLEVDQLFSSETRSIINKVLRLSLENERLSETLKLRLIKSTTFNLTNAFGQFDLNQDGYITAKEMNKVLEDNDWYVTDQELDLLMEMFDRNRDGRISYSEFCQEFSRKI